MERDPDITIRLSWLDRRVTTVVLVNGLPGHEAPRARSVGPGVLVLPGVRTPPEKAELLAKLLFPKPVREHVAARAALLGPGRYVRLRLLLPGAEEAGPYDLGALRWESVRVPSAHAGAEAWREWAGSLALPPDGGNELGQHPWFALVRDVVPLRPAAPAPSAASGIVAVADATSVHGEISTPAGRETVRKPEPGSLRDADRRRVESAVRDSRLAAQMVDSPATAEGIRRTLLGGAQVFYFGGHHLAGGLVVGGLVEGGLVEGGLVVGGLAVDGLAVDGEGTEATWLDVDVLSEWLRDGGVGLAVLMACDSAGSWTDSSDDAAERYGQEVSAAEKLVRSGVPHVVAVQGQVSHGQAAGFAGRFFGALVRGLTVDLALREGAVALEGAVAVPVLYARHDSADLTVGELLPALRSARLAPVAHRLPVAPDPADPALAPPDERHRVQLDVRWCLAERPVRDVLADPGADDLVTVLTDAERVLLRARAARGLPHEGRRRWYVCDVAGSRLPATEAALRRVVSPAYAKPSGEDRRGVGLVLRWPAGEEPGAGFPGELDRLHGFGWDLRAVVVQVHGEHPAEVLETAARLAGTLGSGEYLMRARTPEGQGAGPRRRGPSLPSDASTAVERRGARELLGLARAVVDPGRPGPAPEVDARTVVEELNSCAAWGIPSEERQVLAAVRLWWPTLYASLLEAHAAGRTGPGRAVSLRLAAERDEDLDRWLRAAGGAVPVPSHFSPLDRPTPFVDAVVLGLVRSGLRGTEGFDDWLAEASEAVADAVELLDHGLSPVDGSDLESPGVAVALDRAGALAAVRLPVLDPGGQWPGSWALLARRPLTQEIAEWLYGFDEGQRRALGIAPGADRFDLALEDQLFEFREALLPPLRPEGYDG
ncbi:CHAT domain-containing protein [Streptomyces sp. R-07]|uniref:CHAT domain-containing protein n=1 Tax=Streptomyces sp. R-07 TaxID=3404052 RepID=UPI003CECA2BB